MSRTVAREEPNPGPKHKSILYAALSDFKEHWYEQDLSWKVSFQVVTLNEYFHYLEGVPTQDRKHKKVL